VSADDMSAHDLENPPIVVVEDDPWTRLIGVVLDPTTSEERRAAFADFMSPDEPDFAGWCEGLRTRAGGLYPSEVRLVPSQAELRVNQPTCRSLARKILHHPAKLICLPESADSFLEKEPQEHRSPEIGGWRFS